MTVAELIAALSLCDPKASVALGNDWALDVGVDRQYEVGKDWDEQIDGETRPGRDLVIVTSTGEQARTDSAADALATFKHYSFAREMVLRRGAERVLGRGSVQSVEMIGSYHAIVHFTGEITAERIEMLNAYANWRNTRIAFVSDDDESFEVGIP